MPASATVSAHPGSSVSSDAADPRIADILRFWFGAAPPDDASALQRQSQWFTKSPAFDAEIAQRFGPTLAAARQGELHGWAQTALGRLALILVLDQFTRNVHRGQPDSFAGDAQALALALDGLAQGHDQALPPVARVFIYLPLEHAEDPALQARSVAAYAQLATAQADAVPAVQALLAGTLDYARKHQQVIDRFGRFPHRNAILGRRSTAAELDYLAQPGAGF